LKPNRNRVYVVYGPMPKRISTDHDPLFRFHRWLANLREREIEEIKSVPYAPVSHPFVERLIGTIRREMLDRAFFWNATDLERKLERSSCARWRYSDMPRRKSTTDSCGAGELWVATPLSRAVSHPGARVNENSHSTGCNCRRSETEDYVHVHTRPLSLGLHLSYLPRISSRSSGE
jgi:hypothetical protein